MIIVDRTCSLKIGDSLWMDNFLLTQNFYFMYSLSIKASLENFLL